MVVFIMTTQNLILKTCLKIGIMKDICCNALPTFQKKYDCGGIPDNEWNKIKQAFPEQIKLIYGEKG